MGNKENKKERERLDEKETNRWSKEEWTFSNTIKVR